MGNQIYEHLITSRTGWMCHWQRCVCVQLSNITRARLLLSWILVWLWFGCSYGATGNNSRADFHYNSASVGMILLLYNGSIKHKFIWCDWHFGHNMVKYFAYLCSIKENTLLLWWHRDCLTACSKCSNGISVMNYCYWTELPFPPLVTFCCICPCLCFCIVMCNVCKHNKSQIPCTLWSWIVNNTV